MKPINYKEIHKLADKYEKETKRYAYYENRKTYGFLKWLEKEYDIIIPASNAK